MHSGGAVGKYWRMDTISRTRYPNDVSDARQEAADA